MTEIEQAIKDWDGDWDHRQQVLIDWMEKHADIPMVKIMTDSHNRHLKQMEELENL